MDIRVAAVETFFGTDTDETLNKYQEIVDFLDGLDGEDTLQELLDAATEAATEAATLTWSTF